MKPQLIVFTDLDGTLLNHETYSFEPARDALARIAGLQIPLVLCSSKTAAEIIEIRKLLGNCDPFISENGSGIFIPRRYFPFSYPFMKISHGYNVIGPSLHYGELTCALEDIQSETGIRLRGFSHMQAPEVAKLCGFSPEQAGRAKERDYDEPFIIVNQQQNIPAAEQGLRAAAEKRGLYLSRGGRFFHLSGRLDKSTAVKTLLSLFGRRHGPVVSIALGDSANDAPMLRIADVAVLLQKHDGTYEDIPGLSCRYAPAPGPAGWSTAVRELLDEFTHPRDAYTGW